MAIFDKMFGSGASDELSSQKKFEELKQKYLTVLTVLDQQQIRLENLHIENGKLLIRGTAPSQDAKNKVWDQIKLNPNYESDLIADIKVEEVRARGARAGGGQGETYTVRSGDTLSKISKLFYGDANEYMRIFYANTDKLKDPNKIQVGQELTIPPAQ